MNAYENVVRAAFYDELRKLSYKLQGHDEVQGIPVAIENRKGSVRSGKNEDGSEWKTRFSIPYGYIKGTKGADSEEVDAYVGPHKDSTKAYVVHQKKDDGSHDEDTVMLGFKSKTDAHKGILKHYDNPKYVGGVSTVSTEKLKKLIAEGKKLEKISSDLTPAEFLHYAKLAGVGPFGRAPGIFQSFGKDLMAGGKMLGSQKLVSPGTFAPAGLAQRTMGEMAQSTGHHYAHKSTFKNVVNPLGGAIGGMAEGLTRAGGKELAQAGHGVGGRMGNAMRASGVGLQRAAKGVGAAGEIAGLAGLGTALGAPLSAAGLLGGKAIGAAAPGLEHALHHAGQVAHHAVSDIAGNTGHSIMDKARKAFGLVQSVPALPRTGYSIPPPPMAAHA